MNKKCNLKDSIVNNANKYAIFNPHTLAPVVKNGDKIVGIFIDPAIKTCAMRIAENNRSTNEVKTLVQVLLDFRCNETEFATSGTSYYFNCFDVLDTYKDYFINSHYIIMEHQSTRASYNVIRISQQILSYFLSTVRDKGCRPLIIEIDARLKSSFFNIPRMKKPLLKKRTTEIAINILKERGENELANKIEKISKNDDHGDTICYEFLWWEILKENKVNLCVKKKSRFILS